MSDFSALILGASGLVGSELLKRLLEEPKCKGVVALVRRPLPVSHPKLVQEKIDPANLNTSTFASADCVFCCLGTTIKKAGSQEAFRKVDYELPLRAAELAVTPGSRLKKFFIVTAVDADPRSRVFYSRVKGELEQALCALPIPELHVFRPSLLLGPRAEQRFGEEVGKVFSKALGFAFVGRLRRYKPVHATAVAHAMVQAALKKAERGQFFHESEELH